MEDDLMREMIPATLWTVFCSRWLDITKAPADAPHWLQRGYLMTVPQGKLVGYVVALPAYRWIMEGRR
jgi:hypothetical protein